MEVDQTFGSDTKPHFTWSWEICSGIRLSLVHKSHIDESNESGFTPHWPAASVQKAVHPSRLEFQEILDGAVKKSVLCHQSNRLSSDGLVVDFLTPKHSGERQKSLYSTT